MGTQFHPEFKSRPTKPSPIFKEFINASKTHSTKKSEGHSRVPSDMKE